MNLVKLFVFIPAYNAKDFSKYCIVNSLINVSTNIQKTMYAISQYPFPYWISSEELFCIGYDKKRNLEKGFCGVGLTK